MSDTINYGIDLGTTNSAIAKCDGDEVRILKNRDQMDVTPSVVRIDKRGRITVGRKAYNNLFVDPENVAAGFKRWMGQSDCKTFKDTGESLSAEELSAEVLKSLLADARKQIGEAITTAVITVPAAFGQLQCEATVRAANLAGLTEAPLLQEPLAASIAYGMKSDAKDKRWLVYDLGGGTFDIAIVSTKGGQLSVLEHRGNNMLGGRDFDRLIVEKIFLPRLRKLFNISENTPVWRRFYQQLLLKAEETKIDLSFSEEAVVDIFDIGKDKDDNPIETEFEVTRTELNHLVEPFIAETIKLCKQAISAARITPQQDIATIILVGGPTQMPIVREMLTAEFGVPLDFTIDPMTVVARGAAIYAATLPRENQPPKTTKPEAIDITLAHERVWPEPTCLVAGRIENLPQDIDTFQILIEAEAGHWNSGWLPIEKGYFETKVHLLEGKMNRFWIYLRDGKGKDLTPNPDSFSILCQPIIGEPPLPHSIGVEVVCPDGKAEIDVIFPRSTPLPAQRIITYKANKTLRPSQKDDYLAIKIWEGEHFSDPESNTIVGVLKISASDIRRPIPEGAEIEFSIEIDISRKMEVQAFIPVLNQHFQGVYVAKDNEPSLVEKVKELDSEIDYHFERLEVLRELADETDDYEVSKELEELSTKAEELAEEHYRFESGDSSDPDDAKRLVQQSKEIRGRLSEIEKRIKSKNRLSLALRNVEIQRIETEEVVKKWGGRIDQKEYELLCREADRQIERENERALEKVAHDFEALKWHVLFKQDWFWKEIFDSLCQPDVPFVNEEEAQRLIAQGKEALAQGDGDVLREIVRRLWDLQPKSAVEIEKEKALEAGIRKE